MTNPLYAEIDKLRVENKEIHRLIDKAADFIGTDPELRSIACIDVALDYAGTLRRWLAKELEAARDREKEWEG